MNRKQFIGAALAVLVSSTLSFGQTTSKEINQCTATTKKNVQCKNNVKGNGKLCYLHNPNYVKNDSKSVQCKGTSESTNSQCRRKTKHSSGLCHSHRKTK